MVKDVQIAQIVASSILGYKIRPLLLFLTK